MPISKNIKRLRDIFGITQKELAEIAGVTENAVSKWENGYAEPRMGALERIAACYGITKSCIIEENGMENIDPITKKLKPFIPLNAIKLKEPTTPAYLPLRGRVHAGEAQEPDVLDENVPVPYEVYANHKDGYLLEVEGNCMDKVYPEGCYILIDPHAQPTNGSIAVVSIDGNDYVMRRLYRGANTMVLSPESHDPSYEDIIINESDDHTVSFQGTVVWFQATREME